MSYEEFLIEEYKKISEAHFNTVQTISNFYNHYLVIMSLPFTAIVILMDIGKNAQNSTQNSVIVSFPPIIVTIACFLIGLLGMCLMLYIFNLRFDALLYARTINGIRKYFTEKSGLNISDLNRYDVLPISIFKPRYFEKYYFLHVVIGFALFNSAYFIFGLWWTDYLYTWKVWLPAWHWLILFYLILLCIHVCLYSYYAEHRETQYFSNHIIGIDIDGVLNCHRETFCEKLKKYCNINIKPEEITKIPIHECKELGVTKEDELKVFNKPDYWIEMKHIDNASDMLKKIKNMFGYKIYIFTWRGWPDNDARMSNIERKEMKTLWDNAVPLWYRLSRLNSRKAIMSRITKKWLQENNIPFDKMILESGNNNNRVAHWEMLYCNRLAVSTREQVKLFVEDDLNKAKRLADVCDIVFLMNQPYNQTSVLPVNIVRVNSWVDIYHYIRDNL